MEDMNVPSMVEEGDGEEASVAECKKTPARLIKIPLITNPQTKESVDQDEASNDVLDFLIKQAEEYKQKDLKPEDLYPTQYETTVFVHTSVRITKSGRRKARYEGHVFGGRTTAELLMKWGQYRAIQNFLWIQRIIRIGESAKRSKEASRDGIS